MLVTDTNRKWWIAVSVALAAGLVLLDETIVGVALPQIAQDLSMSVETSHWVVSAYLLAFAGFAGAAGRFADLFGIRRVFVFGATLFALSSALAGLAQSGEALIAARALQGFAAAIIFPVAYAMVSTAFPDEQKGSGLGLLAAIGTTMLALGPFVGGVFTSLVSWRMIFFVNIPVAMAAVACVFVFGRPTARQAGVPTDPIGLTLLLFGLILLVLGIMQGPQWGWTGPAVPAAIIVGVGALTLFVLHERRVKAPLVDVRLFGYPTVSAAALVFFTGQLTKIVVVVFVPLYLQHRLGLSPVVAGGLMLAGVVGSPLMSVPAGRIADRSGSRIPALAGLAATTLGTAAIGVAASIGSDVLMVIALLFWGFALPLNFLPAARAVMKAVPQTRQGEAAGITVTSRLVGGVFGMSGASAVYASSGRYDVVFYVAAALMVVVFVIAFASIERGDQQSTTPPPQQT